MHVTINPSIGLDRKKITLGACVCVCVCVCVHAYVVHYPWKTVISAGVHLGIDDQKVFTNESVTYPATKYLYTRKAA